jgi:hypothetical protein
MDLSAGLKPSIALLMRRRQPALVGATCLVRDIGISELLRKRRDETSCLTVDGWSFTPRLSSAVVFYSTYKKPVKKYFGRFYPKAKNYRGRTGAQI